MTNQDQPEGASPAQMPTARSLLMRVWQGMLVFGILNLPLVIVASIVGDALSGIKTPGLASAVLFALFVGLIVAVSLSSGWRAFAAGVLVGYVLMTIVTSGECTLLTRSFDSEFESRALNGLLLYVLALVVFIVALGIAEGVAAWRHR